MRNALLIVLLCLGGIEASSASAEKPNEARDMMREMGYGGLKGKKLTKAIEAAEAYPLGSAKNPVRENMPEGEGAYLSRLRCSDGTPPVFERDGSVGDSPYGYIMDLYSVTCTNSDPVKVYMDMYHDGGENRPIPGFTIVSS